MNYGIGNVKAKIGGGDAELNLAYGLTPPSDTSKIWVRTDKTPTSEKQNYLLPVNVDINDLEVETLISNDSNLQMANPCMFYYKNYIYFIGGNTNSISTNSIKRYNLETNELEILDATFPVPIARTTPIVIGDNAYIIGGYKVVSGGTATSYYTLYKLDLKTLTATLETSDSNNINAENYDIFKFDDENIIWNLNGTNKTIKYNIKTQTITSLGTKQYTNGVNMGSKNKYGAYSSYGYNYSYLSINILSLGFPVGQTRRIYSYNNDSTWTRYGMGSFSIGRNVFMVGGIRGSSWVEGIEKVNVDKKLTNVEIMQNITLPANPYVAINQNENMGIAFSNKYLYRFTYKFTLNENESFIELDENSNVANCYIGNSSNKAELYRVYKYNSLTEVWEGINCQDYTIE